MRSLSAHVRQSGSHGHLPFHPACAVCRAERLVGAPPDDALLSLRARSVLVAGLLAASAIPATPAIADEPDSEREGALDEGGSPPPSERDPGYGEGHGDGDLPEEGEQPPENEGRPVEETPSQGTPPSNDGRGNPETPAAGPEGTRDPTPRRPRTPADPSATPSPSRGERPGRSQSPERPPGGGRKPGERNRVAPVATPESGIGSKAPAAGAPARPESSSSAQTAAGRSAGGAPVQPERVGRTHVVRPGQSLWSIARGELGQRATPAQVAQLVNRLWELNLERIGTGDPDLIMAGTELRLPS